MKYTIQKRPALHIKRETLRRLDRQQLGLVAGGETTLPGASWSFCASACLGQTCVQK